MRLCHAVSLECGVLESSVVLKEEGLLPLQDLIHIPLCRPQQQLICALVEAPEETLHLLLLVLGTH